MTRRPRVAVAAAVLAVLAGAGVALRVGRDSGSTDTSATVRRGEFRSVVRATGKLEAELAYEIGPPSARDIWNYNLSWMTPEGTRVEKGDVVARFDATEIEDQLREHQATLETAKQEREKEERNLDVSLRQLHLDLVKAQSELKRVDLDLAVPAGIVAGIELEQARLKKELATRRVAFLQDKIGFEKNLVRAKLELLDVKRKFAEQKIAYNEEVKAKFTIEAPVAGLVVYVPKRGGDRWEVGESVWMLAKVLKIADLTTLRVEVSVLEVDAARLAVGQPTVVTVDALPGLSIESKVAELGRIVRPRSEQDPSKVFDAFLPLTDVKSDQLRPGMGVKVEIETTRQPDRLTVPLEAVGVATDGPFVRLRTADGEVRRKVTLGDRNDAQVIVESGLDEGDIVLLAGRA